MFVRGQRLEGQVDVYTAIEGDAELRRGDTVIRADRLQYSAAEDLAQARGQVRMNRAGNLYEGSALDLHVGAFEGFFSDARYRFLATQGHGQAQRVQFLDAQRSVVEQATYTTCQRDEQASWQPAWVLRAERIHLDMEEDVGVAENATLEFQGMALPAIGRISFPLSDKRKSGLLPPMIGMDKLGGIEYSQPYYWNIAPNRDMTITPTLMTKRGVSLGTQFRYLEPGYNGALDLQYMPDDKLRDRARWAYGFKHQGSLNAPLGDLGLKLNLNRVSDDNYWRDFSSLSGSRSSIRLATTRRSVEHLLSAITPPAPHCAQCN